MQCFSVFPVYFTTVATIQYRAEPALFCFTELCCYYCDGILVSSEGVMKYLSLVILSPPRNTARRNIKYYVNGWISLPARLLTLDHSQLGGGAGAPGQTAVLSLSTCCLGSNVIKTVRSQLSSWRRHNTQILSILVN